MIASVIASSCFLPSVWELGNIGNFWPPRSEHTFTLARRNSLWLLFDRRTLSHRREKKIKMKAISCETAETRFPRKIKRKENYKWQVVIWRPLPMRLVSILHQCSAQGIENLGET